jgi:hypothetical protein
MAVKTAQRHTDGDQEVIFFSHLAGELNGKGTLLVFRITELLDPERGEFSWHGPLVGDVLVVDSEENPEWNGRIIRNMEVRFAPTWNLRGQAKPGDDVKRMRDIPAGENEEGDDVICRIWLKKGKSPNGFVAVDPPTKAEEKEALALMKRYGGDNWPAYNDGTGSPNPNKADADTVLGRAEQRSKAKQAAAVEDDTEPPF